MPILLALDFETTGLDFEKDQPIEVGAILYSTGQKRCLNTSGYLVKTTIAITPEITEKTGITKQAVDKFGYSSIDGLEMLEDMIEQADFIIGHNVRRFDRRMYNGWLTREHWVSRTKSITWIDTFKDLPFGVPVGQLSHVAADHGFLNLFPHSAIADCQTVLKLAEHYDPTVLITRAGSPEIVLQACHARHENDKAKKRRFRWNPENKIWWKAVKECDLQEEAALAPFDVAVRKEFTVDQLDD